jgi:hypothetical protein
MAKDTVGRKLHRVEIETDNGFHGVYWIAEYNPLDSSWDPNQELATLKEKIHRLTGGFPTVLES